MANGDSNGFRPIGTITDTLVRYYGPLGFGFALFMAMWFLVVRPALETTRVDYEQQIKITEALRDTSKSMEVSSTLSNQTALIMERVVEDLLTIRDGG